MVKLEEFITNLSERKESFGTYIFHLTTKDVPIGLKLRKQGQKIAIDIENKPHSSCLLMDVDRSEPDAITSGVRHLGSCAFEQFPLSGNELLKIIDFINLSLNVRMCRLDDEATIDLCQRRTNLAVLRLLTTGKTWYQTHGFQPTSSADLLADFEDNPSELNFAAL
jgi:hypothetical protein